jgi:bifunctional UDP-N-acetylglucosamine pyrophosphorylase/glucosamine-1-phosphate N-acetyltransferase
MVPPVSNPTITIAAIVLAAGKGTRMKSDLPKVLHQVQGTPMVVHVLKTLEQMKIDDVCLILNPDLAPFKPLLREHPHLRVCVQTAQRGTADAVASACGAFSHVKKPHYTDSQLHHGTPMQASHVIICCGDTPALRADILKDFVSSCLDSGCELGVIGALHPQPTGYGRLVRNAHGHLEKIVEEKDATDEIRSINLINTGLIFARADLLFDLLDEIQPNNKQGEYYLTDCFALAAARNKPSHVYITEDYFSFSGVNTQEQLKEIEHWLSTHN